MARYIGLHRKHGIAAPAAVQHEDIVLLDKFLDGGFGLFCIAAVIFDHKFDFASVDAAVIVGLLVDRSDAINELREGTRGAGKGAE